MKKAYVSPDMEIVLFDAEDVITTSGGFGDNPYDPTNGWLIDEEEI